MSNQEVVPSHRLCHNIPFDLLVQVDEYVKKQRKHSRTEAINEMINVGLIINKNKQRLEDPKLMQELYGQLKEGGLVDFVSRMNPTDFNLVHSIIDTEFRNRRGMKVTDWS